MLETLLSYGGDAKKTHLTSALFYKDQVGRLDSLDFADATRHKGLARRRQLASESRVFDMMGRLHADIFFQDRYMINEIGVKITLEMRRLKLDLVMYYNILHGFVDIDAGSLFDIMLSVVVAIHWEL